MRRFGLGLCAVLSVPASGLAAPRHAPPQLRAQVQGVDDRALRTAIERAVGETPGDPPNRIEARRRAKAAADSATALLRSEGYYDAAVVADIGQGDRPKAVITVTPGARTLLAPTKVDWVGPPPSAAAAVKLEAALGLRPGDPGRAIAVLAAEGRLVAVLQQNGYADAKADTRDVVVDHAGHTMTPTFRIAAGRLVRMDGMRLSDKGGRTDPRLLRRLAPWAPRDVYKPDDVAELERRLLDTGVYDSVTVALAPAPNADGLRPVVVSLADRTKHALSLGLGYSTTEGVLVDSTYSTFNVLHRADTVTLFAKAQTIDSRLGVTESLPHFWSPGQTLRFGPDIFHDVTNAYSTTGAEFVVDLTQRYGKSSFFTKGFSLVGSRIDDHELGKLDILSVRPLAAVSFDRTDNVLDSHRGYKVDARVEPIAVLGGETLTYLKLQSQFSAFFPLDASQDTVLAARIHGGSIIGGKIPQVPASDRFFAGGGGSVRGYAYQNVGPHYADNTPQGGLSLIEGSIELRRKVFGPLGVVLFVDTGTVGLRATPSFSQIASAVGLGLRYDLGFAPVRVDVATPINQVSGASQPPFQIYLSVGQSF